MQFNTNYNGSNSVRYRSTRFDVQKLSKVKFYTIQYLIYVCVYKIPNLVEASRNCWIFYTLNSKVLRSFRILRLMIVLEVYEIPQTFNVFSFSGYYKFLLPISPPFLTPLIPRNLPNLSPYFLHIWHRKLSSW